MVVRTRTLRARAYPKGNIQLKEKGRGGVR